MIANSTAEASLSGHTGLQLLSRAEFNLLTTTSVFKHRTLDKQGRPFSRSSTIENAVVNRSEKVVTEFNKKLATLK